MIATAWRVIAQLRHDPRSLGLIFVVPVVLISLLYWVFNGGAVFNQIAPQLLVLFPLLIMFLITSITTLRERSSGTLERLLTMPLSKGGFLGGYALAFGALASISAIIVALVTIGWLGLDPVGPWGLLLLVAVVDAVLGVSLGLSVSAFANTEFQAIQFFPALILPQFLLGGLLVPRDLMPDILHWISNVLPLSYAMDAASAVSTQTDPDILGDLIILVAFIIGLLVLGAFTLRRRTP